MDRILNTPVVGSGAVIENTTLGDQTSVLVRPWPERLPSGLGLASIRLSSAVLVIQFRYLVPVPLLDDLAP